MLCYYNTLCPHYKSIDQSLALYIFSKMMNYLGKLMGYQADLKTQMQNSTFSGSCYRVIKDARNIIFSTCDIRFLKEEEKFMICFSSKGGTNEEAEEYVFPIHLAMNPVTFVMNKAGNTNVCFEWVVDEGGDHIGCYMDPKSKDNFKKILCRALQALADDENIKDPLGFCQELSGIPIYKDPKESTVSSNASNFRHHKEILNQVLIKQANKEDTKMVHTASCYEHCNNERKLMQGDVVFVLRIIGELAYEFQLVNQTGFTFLRKELRPSLVYEVNTDLGYLKWLHSTEEYKLIEVNFDGERDAALSLKYNIMECMYEINSGRKLTDAIAEDEISYMKRIAEKDKVEVESKIIKIYEQPEDYEIKDLKIVYDNKEAKQGLEKYKNLCQAKINDFDIVSLGSMLETMKITEDNQINIIEKKRLFNKQAEEVNVGEVLLHDNDTKAFIRGEDGKLYYQDLEKGKVVQEYNLSPKNGVRNICPEFKLAETTQFKNFKAISSNSIYEVDPRTVEGACNKKDYSTNPKFNTLAVDQKGRYATGSQTGEIRMYNSIGKKAWNKYRLNGDPVLHLESTKDGKWLLATFQKELILLPTETEEDQSMYESQIPYAKRPLPIKLTLKLEHMQLLKIKQDFSFIPAKFDESKESTERFIVSGFNNYVVIWNMGNVLRGDKSYKFTTTGQNLIQADFQYNNVRRLLMVTDEGINIKENKLTKK